MSIVDNFKGRRADQIRPLDFSDLDKRTAAVEKKQADLRKRILELDASLGEVAARAPLGDEHRRLNKELQDADEALHLLNQSFDGIKAEREKMIARNTALNAQAMRVACNANIEATVSAADELAQAAQSFVAAYQKMIVHARKAFQSTPVGCKVPDGLLTPGQLRADVSAELFRLAAEASGNSIARDSLLLPHGANCPDINLLDNPAAIKPFVETVREHADAFRSAIKEQAQ